MTEPRVYQAGDGRWLVFNNDIKSDYFVLEEDATDMATKLTLAQQVQSAATEMAQLGENLAAIHSVYFDRGYNSGGSNEITNDDLASLGITAVQLGNVITVAEKFDDFLNNVAVAAADRSVNLNAIRTDI